METSGKILHFLKNLKPDFILPQEVSVMHPYKNQEVWDIASAFYTKYYNDFNTRILVLAINPGRLGAGITGVPFTDPVRLEEACNIQNSLQKKKELSGQFIYEMIHAFGGLKKFYGQFMLSSLCPLGFIKEGKNVNYYDTKSLQNAATPFIIENIWKQKRITGNLPVCLCLGEGKNYQYFSKLNQEYRFFSHILPLPHPRYILQYKRKQKEEYIDLYLNRLRESIRMSAIKQIYPD